MSFNLNIFNHTASQPILNEKHLCFQQIEPESHILPNILFWGRNEVKREQLQKFITEILDNIESCLPVFLHKKHREVADIIIINDLLVGFLLGWVEEFDNHL